MEFIFDLTALYNLGDMGLLALMWYIFIKGGWIIFTIFFFWASYTLWIMERENKYFSQFKFVILAIDVPKDTEQTPKAVEQLFSTLSGAHMPLSAKEKYWEGVFQLSFSFEIVSIDGYVQFLIRMPEQWRDLVESSVYSQYPDAEITEVEDYVNEIPTHYPNDTHNIWGAEVILARNDVYPIRTYTEFEDSVSGEFKDPLASLLETMSKIKVGEQVWLQIIIKPTGFDWPKRSEKEAYRLAGKKSPVKEGWLNKLFGPLVGIFFLSSGEPFFIPSDLESQNSSTTRKKDEMPSMMLHLTPGERGAIEAIERKAGKNGFECKIRLIYISPLDKYEVPRVIHPVFGSIKQFNTLDLNSFKPDPKTKTQIIYFFINYRKNLRRRRLMEAYKARSGIMGHDYFILNTEELASIWHFPSKYIIAPLLKRTESKKSGAPSSLPIEEKTTVVDNAQDDLRKQLESKEYNFNLENKHFEQKFAKPGASLASGTKKSDPPTNLPIN